MKLNKLLERQINKFISPGLKADESLQQFFYAVSDSYNAYERDHVLSDRAFKISEEEYIRINEELKKENTKKKLSIVNLKETISTLGDDEINDTGDDLLGVVRYLKQQVEKRKTAENESNTIANRLTSLIVNMQEGILVEDEQRRIALTNHCFCTLFNIGIEPHLLVGADCSNTAEESKHLFKDPVQFVNRIHTIISDKKLVIGDELELADGRFFERDFIPIYINEEYKGHLWKYEDITERKKAEEKLKASEQLWQFALEGAGDGVWEYNFVTNTVFFSKQYKKMLGYEDAEFSNDANEWQSRVHPEDLSMIQEVDKLYYTKKITTHQLEYRIKHKNGNYLWILDRGMIINYSESGKPQRIIGTHTDITQRKQNEEELKRLSLVASANENGVVFTDVEGKITWCNEGFCKTTGFLPEDILGKTPVELLHGELTDAEQLQKMIDLFFSGHNFDVELMCYRKNKTHFWGRAKGQSVLNGKGEVLQYFAIVEDISNEKEAQQKLAEFEQRFRTALEKIGDNVWEHDMVTGKTSFSNSAGISGYVPGKTKDNVALWWNQVPAEDRRMLVRNNQLYKEGKIDHHILEYRLINSDGSERWVLDRGVVIEKDKDDKPLKIVGTHTDITERKKAEQLLQMNEEKYRSIIANMNLGLLEVDNNEIIQYANQCFCNMSGYELEELKGRKASLLFTRGESSEMIETKNDLRKKGISDAYEIAMKNKRGELKWWLISGAPRFDDQGNLVGSIGIHLDITEQKEIELELHDAREAAEQSAKTKELFLANMSHEIRTPMNAILGMAHQLNKTTLNSTQHFYLDTISKAADHLLVVINDILDISKIEAGKLSLERIGFKPDEVIKHCMMVMNHRAEEKGLRLLKEGGEGHCPVFIGDPHRLTQVMLNLISNAVKFTEKGYVLVKCKLTPEISRQQSLIVSVTDTGIGMDESYQESLFQKFTQEETTTARKYGGTGLGMSISKQLIELMNGSIDVKSKKGAGTTITISVPFEVGSINDIPKEKGIVADTSILKDKKILLVEDNEMNRLVANAVLETTGVIITEAENGLEAIECLKQQEYDLILMDVQMPVMDGLEAAAKIRKDINKTIPIIALTANAIKGESDRCRAAGMNDFLSKPFEEEELIQMLCHWLESGSIESKSNKQALQTKRLYDLSSLNRISQGNTAFLKKMVTLFNEQVPKSVQEMKDALQQKDFTKLRSIAHKIKPAIDNMGIAALHQVIRDIEKNAAEAPDIFMLSDKLAKTEEVITNVTAQLFEEPALN